MTSSSARRAALLGLCLCTAVTSAKAQDPTVRAYGPDPAVVRLGESSRVRLQVDRPGVDLRVESAPMQNVQVQIGPSSSQQQISIIQGRREERGTTTVEVVLTPTTEGRHSIPGFTVSVGGQRSTTAPVVLETIKDLRGAERGYLKVTPSSTRLYVHEPLRLIVEAGVDASLSLVEGTTRDGRTGFDVELLGSWLLSELPGTVGIDLEAPPDAPVLFIQQRAIPVRHTAQHEKDGRTWRRFVLERALLPTQPGHLELSQLTMRYKIQVGRPRRGVFGEVLAGDVESLYVYGEPLSVEVLPLPEAGRPPDFSGGVGRFTVAARADRQQLKVGTSLKLTLTIAGNGNLEFLRPPDLDRLEGFHFFGRTERRLQDRVEVVYDLAPLTESVTRIPEVRFSFFDTTPGTERYETVLTSPLPLKVEPLPPGETLLALPDAAPSAVTPGVDDIFDLRPLEGTPILPAPAPAQTVTLLLLVAPWLLMLMGWLFVRQRLSAAADRTGRRARAAAKRFSKRRAEGVEPSVALGGYLADRLDVPDAAVVTPDLQARLAHAGLPDDLAARCAAAVDAGLAARYAGAGATGLSDTNAEDLVRQAEVAFAKTRSTPKVLAMLLALATVQTLPAQEQHTDPATTGKVAYRQGDYKTAAAAFEQLVDTPHVDGRNWFNLGNAWYRTGRFPEALYAYEQARRAMPRDPELTANLQLTRRQLEIGSEEESFTTAAASLRDWFTGYELLLMAITLHALTALGWFFVRPSHRGLWRFLATFCGIPALLLTVELVLLRPARPARGIVVQTAPVVSEPRAGLQALMTLKPGVVVQLLAEGDAFAKVEVKGRSGYLESTKIRVLR